MAARESASAPFQIWYLATSGSNERRVTNDLNDYRGVLYHQGSASLLVVRTNLVSGVWTVPAADLTSLRVAPGQFPIKVSNATQIVSGTNRLQDVAWTNDNKVLYVSYASDGSNVWITEPNARGARPLTLDARNIHGMAVSPDGRHLVFSSDRAGRYNLWKLDMSSGELQQLTRGEADVSPRFSPDGRWVVYQSGFPAGARVWRVAIDGGEAVALTETRAQNPDVSPYCKLISYHTLDSESPSSPWIFGAMPFGGGPLLKRFTFGPTVGERTVRWVPGGWGLAYVDSPGGVSNIWVQPLDGSAPLQLSDFKNESIDSFDWSPDGLSIAVVRSTK